MYEAAHEGDELALEVVRDTARFLGAGVANLLNMFNPEVVVVCGGVTLAGDHLFVPLRREVARRAFKPAVARVPHRARRAGGHRGRVRGGQDVPADAAMPKVGVLGSLVWDQIYGRDPLAAPVEEWGGIAYALASLDAASPRDGRSCRSSRWARISPARRASSSAGSGASTPGGRCVEVPAPNNRVVLHYYSSERRTERMSGGVPGWTWAELGPMVRDLDALYLNFISGFELALGTAQALRQGFRGPIYWTSTACCSACSRTGSGCCGRSPDAASWLGCFDVVQLNEDEMRQLSPDPLQSRRRGARRRDVAARRDAGGEGAAYVAAPGFDGWADRRSGGQAVASAGHDPPADRPPDRPAARPPAALAPRSSQPPVDALDPTGCGDVFGAAAAARLLAGDPVEDAIRHANAMAARNAAFRGAGGLSRAPARRAGDCRDPRHRGPRPLRRPELRPVRGRLRRMAAGGEAAGRRARARSGPRRTG